MHHLTKSLIVLPFVVAAGTMMACRDGGPEPAAPPEVPARVPAATALDPWQVGVAHNAILHEAITHGREARRDPARWAAVQADPCGAAVRAVSTQSAFAARALGVAPADVMLAAEFQRAVDPACGGDPAAADAFSSRFREADARLRRSGAPLTPSEAADVDAALRQAIRAPGQGGAMATVAALQAAADGPVTPSRFVVAGMASLGGASQAFWAGKDLRYPTDIAVVRGDYEGEYYGPIEDALGADLSACTAAVAFVRRFGVSDPRLLTAACLGAGGAASAAYGYNLLK